MTKTDNPKESAMHEECWGYASEVSPDSWNGNCKTRAEAIAEGRQEHDGGFFIIRGHQCHATDFTPTAEEVAEMMWERASDGLGDMTDDFPDLSAAQRAEFDAFMAQWASQIECRFWISDGEAEAIGPAE